MRAGPARRDPAALAARLQRLQRRLAGLLGLPLAFAQHFSSRNTVAGAEVVPAAFRPSDVLDRPYSLIGVQAFAAEDEKEAPEVLTGAIAMLRLRTGRPLSVPTPEEAEGHDSAPAEREFVDSSMADVQHGTPQAVREGLDALAGRTGADELIITANTTAGRPGCAPTS